MQVKQIRILPQIEIDSCLICPFKGTRLDDEERSQEICGHPKRKYLTMLISFHGFPAGCPLEEIEPPKDQGYKL